MRENKDQKNSEYRHFWCSGGTIFKTFVFDSSYVTGMIAQYNFPDNKINLKIGAHFQHKLEFGLFQD